MNKYLLNFLCSYGIVRFTSDVVLLCYNLFTFYVKGVYREPWEI
jgi:hypothetical protein